MQNRKYLSVTETAALIRQSLKEAFPGVKFTVRSSKYAGGSSISVSWVDGPAAALVDAITGRFEASYVDGMIDYKGSCYHTLNGEPVRFGADFINIYREYSEAAKARAVAFVRSTANPDVADSITVEAFTSGQLYNVFPHGGEWSHANSAQTLVHARLAKVSDRAAPAHSVTAASAVFAGDDGYGMGTVGDLAKPEADRITNGGYSEVERKLIATSAAGLH